MTAVRSPDIFIYYDPEPSIVPEYLTLSGARRLADEIEAYWRERGKAVRCRIESFSGLRSDRGLTYVVRSDMIGALPR